MDEPQPESTTMASTTAPMEHIDDLHGWNFLADIDMQTETDESRLHGTAAAGILAAQTDNEDRVGQMQPAHQSPRHRNPPPRRGELHAVAHGAKVVTGVLPENLEYLSSRPASNRPSLEPRRAASSSSPPPATMGAKRSASPRAYPKSWPSAPWIGMGSPRPGRVMAPRSTSPPPVISYGTPSRTLNMALSPAPALRLRLRRASPRSSGSPAPNGHRRRSRPISPDTARSAGAGAPIVDFARAAAALSE